MNNSPANFCPHCGTPLQSGQNVCPQCGAAINQTPQQAQNLRQSQQINPTQGYYKPQPSPQNGNDSNLRTAFVVISCVLVGILVGFLIWFLIGSHSKSESTAVRQQEQIDKLQQDQDKIKEENENLKQALEKEKGRSKTTAGDVVSTNHSGGSVNLNMNGSVGGSSSLWMNGSTGGYWVDYGNGSSNQRKLRVSSFNSSTGSLILTATDDRGKYIGKFVGTVSGSGSKGDYGSYSGTFTNYKGVKLHFNYYD